MYIFVQQPNAISISFSQIYICIILRFFSLNGLQNILPSDCRFIQAVIWNIQKKKFCLSFPFCMLIRWIILGIFFCRSSSEIILNGLYENNFLAIFWKFIDSEQFFLSLIMFHLPLSNLCTYNFRINFFIKAAVLPVNVLLMKRLFLF